MQSYYPKTSPKLAINELLGLKGIRPQSAFMIIPLILYLVRETEQGSERQRKERERQRERKMFI